MKYIPIVSCNQCRFRSVKGLRGDYRDYCLETKRVIDSDSIPEWCVYPDAPAPGSFVLALEGDGRKPYDVKIRDATGEGVVPRITAVTIYLLPGSCAAFVTSLVCGEDDKPLVESGDLVRKTTNYGLGGFSFSLYPSLEGHSGDFPKSDEA